MSDLIELVINSMQRYAGHKTDAKSHAEHIVNTVIDEAILAMEKERNGWQREVMAELGINSAIEAIEKLKY